MDKVLADKYLVLGLQDVNVLFCICGASNKKQQEDLFWLFTAVPSKALTLTFVLHCM